MELRPCAGFILWVLVIEQTRPRQHLLAIQQPGGTCSWGDRLECQLPSQARIAIGLNVAGMLLYMVMFEVHLLRAWRLASTRLYQNFRLTYQVMQIQVCTSADQLRGTL